MSHFCPHNCGENTKKKKYILSNKIFCGQKFKLKPGVVENTTASWQRQLAGKKHKMLLVIIYTLLNAVLVEYQSCKNFFSELKEKKQITFLKRMNLVKIENLIFQQG